MTDAVLSLFNYLLFNEFCPQQHIIFLIEELDRNTPSHFSSNNLSKL